jgi:LDH2 family malate/lactate/ureidoglycolate dehydrogenase
LESVGVTEEDRETVADVLLAADLGGIDSHGCARLRRYVDGIDSGAINRRAEPTVVRELAATALLDADNGLGQPSAVAATRLAIEKARSCGAGVVSVRRSNHFGIAGYYASLAAREGLIGVVMTNASPQVAPTFGAEPMFGTNPLAIAMPSGAPADFLLDIATSTVGRGKLEVRHRQGEAIPEGWVIDTTGATRTDVAELIEGLKARSGYSLLPLGGQGEEHGGHKGYGLGLAVDLLCGPLAGAAWGRHVYGDSGAELGHLVIAMQVEAMRDLSAFREDCRTMFEELRRARRTEGAARIFIPGEKEIEESALRTANGIPLTDAVCDDLVRLAAEREVRLPKGIR